MANLFEGEAWKLLMCREGRLVRHSQPKPLHPMNFFIDWYLKHITVFLFILLKKIYLESCLQLQEHQISLFIYYPALPATITC